jgi:hypothetical protein
MAKITHGGWLPEDDPIFSGQSLIFSVHRSTPQPRVARKKSPRRNRKTVRRARKRSRSKRAAGMFEDSDPVLKQKPGKGGGVSLSAGGGSGTSLSATGRGCIASTSATRCCSSSVRSVGPRIGAPRRPIDGRVSSVAAWTAPAAVLVLGRS